jgi:hypothetical protein
MRTLLWAIVLGALTLSGCAKKKMADPVSQPQPRAGARAMPTGGAATNQTLIVTPESGLVAKVVGVNTPGRFVVLNFPLGKMATPDQRLNLYRRGLKVGEVKVTGPQREDNIVADLVTGEVEMGDEARSP